MLIALLSLAACQLRHGSAQLTAGGDAASTPTATAAPVRSAAPPTPLLRVVPLLNADEGRRAAAEYPRAAADAKALASGSFTAAGVDEVLLTVFSGRARAAGDHALALMRFSKGRYRFVGNWLIANDTFTARLGLATRSGKDALVVCHQGGQQGLYRGSCGFFGRGGFTKGSKSLGSNAADVPTGFVTQCGPVRSVSLGSVLLRGDAVRFELELSRFVRSSDKGKPARGSYCSHARLTGRESYAIDYRYDGTSFKRTAPIPVAIKKALAKIGQ